MIYNKKINIEINSIKWVRIAAIQARIRRPMQVTCAVKTNEAKKATKNSNKTPSSSCLKVFLTFFSYNKILFFVVADPEFIVTRRDSLGMAAKEHTEKLTMANNDSTSNSD